MKHIMKTLWSVGVMTLLFAGCSSRHVSNDDITKNNRPGTTDTTVVEIDQNANLTPTAQPTYLGAASGGRAL